LGELAIREVESAAANSIVEMVTFRQWRFQQFTAKKLVNCLAPTDEAATSLGIITIADTDSNSLRTAF
jgi:hypothetical protein